VIGILDVASDRPDAFNEKHAVFLSAFANQAALAIQNARLFSEVSRMAITDELTGLFNRRHLFQLAEKEFDRAKRYERTLSLIMLDIDNFKEFNDTYGHLAGDQVMRALGICCRKSLRRSDIVGRYGGEEFMFVLPETTLDQAKTYADRLRQRIADLQIPTPKGDLSITVSLGFASLDSASHQELENLISAADAAMYAAKAAGRNCVSG
jgi:diguanylate cyclase (GGDEF)-like protein